MFRPSPSPSRTGQPGQGQTRWWGRANTREAWLALLLPLPPPDKWPLRLSIPRGWGGSVWLGQAAEWLQNLGVALFGFGRRQSPVPTSVEPSRDWERGGGQSLGSPAYAPQSRLARRGCSSLRLSLPRQAGRQASSLPLLRMQQAPETGNSSKPRWSPRDKERALPPPDPFQQPEPSAGSQAPGTEGQQPASQPPLNPSCCCRRASPKNRCALAEQRIIAPSSKTINITGVEGRLLHDLFEVSSSSTDNRRETVSCISHDDSKMEPPCSGAVFFRTEPPLLEDFCAWGL